MNNLPEQPIYPGWPQFLTDDSDGREFVRLRDGSLTSVSPRLGHSVLYGLLLDDQKVSREHQYVPQGVYSERVTLAPIKWSSDKELEAAGAPGLDPLPRGYDYEILPPPDDVL